MAIVLKPRNTRVDMLSVVAGVWGKVIKDAKGRAIERLDWQPQTIKDKDDNEYPMSVQVPIEEQFNNGRGLEYYRAKGYLPLKEAEAILLRDFPHLKFTPSAAPAAQASAEAAPIDPAALTLKAPAAGKPNKARGKK